MDFYVLGPVEIINEGCDITPTAPKARQVIALLVLRRNEVVRTDELIEELWEDSPPVSAMTTLQTYIYKIRRILQEHGAAHILSTRPGGYLLKASDSAVDLHCFEKDAEVGRRMLEKGDAAGAAEVLSRALMVWRGRALSTVELGPLLSSYVTRLEELRSRTLELRFEADLRCGRHHELISELKSLVLTHPLREHLNALLMIALHGAGRRHEALEVYQTLRTNMIEDLGLEPGRELKRLHQALLSDAPLSWRSAEKAPAVPTSTPARTTAQSTAPAPEPPARAVPAQSPPDVADFTGRQEVIERITGVLAPIETVDRTAIPITVISGMPGAGKTVLAVHVAHLLRSRFPGGQLYAELCGSSSAPRDPAEVLRGFLRALGVPETRIPEGTEERSVLFRSVSAGRRLLVVLDDVRSLTEIRPLLPGDPSCAVVVTGRHRLHGLAGALQIGLDMLSPTESVELLTRMVGRDQMALAPQVSERLVELVGGLPLALRCIGSRLAATRGLPMEELVGQLECSPLQALRVGDLDVRAAFDSSYQALSHLEQSAFRLLSLLPGESFSIEAAGRLLGWDLSGTQRSLERFTDGHLLETVPGINGEPYYRFPALTLSYARERLSMALTGDLSEPLTGGRTDS